MSLTIGSLFSGIGGLELGLEWAGLGPTLWQVEQDPYCRAVLAKHWPDATRYEDVRDVGRSNLVPVDVICGGFPCQDISLAGKGAGIEGERSGLWKHYARIIGEVQPTWVVIENVSALRSRGLDKVLGELAALGYDAEWHCIPAAYVGAPHRRDRVWVVAWRADANGERLAQRAQRDGAAIGPVIEASLGNDADGLRDAVADTNGGGWDGRAGNVEEADGRDEPPNGCTAVADTTSDRREERDSLGEGSSSRTSQGEKHRPWRGDRWWPTEPDVDRVAHGVPSRVDRLRCLGNAVVPQVAEVVGRVVLALEARREVNAHA